MSRRYVDITSAMRRIAERRIEQAMTEGKFDRLAGMGKPLDVEAMAPLGGAAANWWGLRLLRESDGRPATVGNTREQHGS